MDYKMISLIASVIIFNAYAIGITIKFGWLRSISISWKYLGTKNKWIFTVTLFTFSILLIIAGQTLLLFLAGALICLTGAAANTWELEMTETSHVIGATGGIILGTLALIALPSPFKQYDIVSNIFVKDFGFWFLVVPQLIFTILAMRLNMRNHTFWIEVVAFNITALAVLINLIK